MAEVAVCHFNSLPLEMISEILDLIPFREKRKARLVCHLWRMMIESQRSIVFRPKLTNNTSVEYFLKSYRSMDKAIIRNINRRMSKADFGFPRVMNAELGWKNSQGNIERFLTQGCEHAETLTLAKFSLERISRGAISKVLSEINWKNLSQFKVVVTTSNYKDTRARKHLRNVTTVLKYVRIPALRELDFNYDFRYGFADKHKLQYQKLFMGLYHFLVGHSKTLKMLTGRINTTSICTFGVPEIPVDLQQSLLSNMKLVKCGLSLYGVRGLESMINPALFGTELKDLEIQIMNESQSSRSRRRPRLGLLARTFNDNFTGNLKKIFENNGKTLSHVSTNICSITFLSKCTALESFNWRNGRVEFNIIFHAEDQDLKRLSHIKLKSFSAKRNGGNDLTPELNQLLRQSVGTLEHLCLFETHDIRMDDGSPTQFWLRDCVSLKSLKIDHIFEEYIEANMGAQFPYLTELKTNLTPDGRLLLATCITESMRNLEMITITGPYMDIQLLRTLFSLNKLKRLIFAESERRSLPPTPAIEEMKEFCAIPGVTFATVKDGRKIGHSGKMHVITVHRSAAVNPISN